MTATPAAGVLDRVPLDLTYESRYDRQERITWWRQDALARSRVLVAGAGALGNEIVKALALVGVGHVDVVDMDRIENSNLSRCALFHDADLGRPKATAVAERAALLNPHVTITGYATPVQRRGAGAVHDADLVVAGLDNREARLWLGRTCRLLGKPWVDGAIEGLRGVARVFLPEGACYECTLGEVDHQVLAHRRSCSLLAASDVTEGKTPTNATTAAVVAAVEVQEAIKLLVGRDDLLALRNSGWVYLGETLETYVVAYDEDPYCPAHDAVDDLVDLRGCGAGTLGEVVGALPVGGPDVVVDLLDDLVTGARCPGCGPIPWSPRIRGALRPGSGECPGCGVVLAVESRTTVTAEDAEWALPLGDLGFAREDMIAVRSGLSRVHVLLPVAPGQEAGRP